MGTVPTVRQGAVGRCAAPAISTAGRRSAPTAAELDKAVKDGPDKTIAKLFNGGAGQDEYDQISGQMARSIADTNNGVQLRAWWLHRML